MASKKMKKKERERERRKLKEGKKGSIPPVETCARSMIYNRLLVANRRNSFFEGSTHTHAHVYLLVEEVVSIKIGHGTRERSGCHREGWKGGSSIGRIGRKIKIWPRGWSLRRGYFAPNANPAARAHVCVCVYSHTSSRCTHVYRFRYRRGGSAVLGLNTDSPRAHTLPGADKRYLHFDGPCRVHLTFHICIPSSTRNTSVSGRRRVWKKKKKKREKKSSPLPSIITEGMYICIIYFIETWGMLVFEDTFWILFVRDKEVRKFFFWSTFLRST